jgi:hypothetical protein
MGPLSSVLLAVSILLMPFMPAWAASDHAAKLRGKYSLAEYTPPDAFLAGNFVADEIDPAYIFGKVKDFAKSLACPTTWLVEEAEKKRMEARDPQSASIEYTLYLEEDCPGKVTYYVFVDRSRENAAQWMEWRKQFHKSKAEPQYSAAKTSLEQAAQSGFAVEGELRFLEVEGELQLKRPEEVLTAELKFQPIYDLRQGKALTR